MLALAAILVLLWVAGIGFRITSGLLHFLLIAAVIVVIFNYVNKEKL